MCALLLGLRADATHTEAVVTETCGRHWGYVQIPNSQARSSRELLERAFQEASIDYPGPIPPLVTVAALPGLDSEPLRKAAAETVRSVLPTGSRVVLCDELEALLAGALGGEPGHVLSSGHQAGVGSISRDGIFTRTEEPPELMGQEGSGLWLGTRTLQLAARLREGRLPETPRLVSALTEHFGMATLQDVWDTVMMEAPDPLSIVALAERTIQLSEFPDPEPACRALVVRAARRLSELLTMAHQDNDGETATSWHGVSATGALLEEVRRQTPELDWRKPRSSGLEGCLFMARVYGEGGLGEGESLVVDAGPSLWQALRKNPEQLLALEENLAR